MKRIFLFAVIAFSVVSTTPSTFGGNAIAAEDGPAKTETTPDRTKPRFKLHIASEKASYKVGERIFVRIDLKNVSDDEVKVLLTSAFNDFNYTILDSRGKPVELTEVGTQFRSGDAFYKRSNSQIKPGDSLQENIELSLYFNLERAGKYTAKLTRSVVDINNPSKVEEVASNTLSLEIVEKEAAK